jgi:antitoxin component of MazEF toxin-antitoxin module
MRAKLVQIGNSKGLRLSKTLLELTGLADEVDLRVHGDTIVVQPIKRHPREGWADAIARVQAEDKSADWSETSDDVDDEQGLLRQADVKASRRVSVRMQMSEEKEMLGREDLKPWIVESLRASGNRGTVVQIAKHIWDNHKGELEAAGDMFFKWQYEMRWAGNQLVKERVITKSSSDGWTLN